MQFVTEFTSKLKANAIITYQPNLTVLLQFLSIGGQ